MWLPVKWSKILDVEFKIIETINLLLLLPQCESYRFWPGMTPAPKEVSMLFDTLKLIFNGLDIFKQKLVYLTNHIKVYSIDYGSKSCATTDDNNVIFFSASAI